VIVMLLERGPAWQADRPLGEQVGFAEHVERVGALQEQGVVLAAGPFVDPFTRTDDDLLALALLDLVSVADAEGIWSDDPIVVAGCIRLRFHPWGGGEALRRPGVALHSVLRAGSEERYDADHVRIPGDLLAAHRRAGIRDWRIWRSGRDVFHLVDCDDFAAAAGALEDDPANVRWQAAVGELVDHFERPGGGPELPLVWRLSDQ
jgi:L-rhamnose mutarotase